MIPDSGSPIGEHHAAVADLLQIGKLRFVAWPQQHRRIGFRLFSIRSTIVAGCSGESIGRDAAQIGPSPGFVLSCGKRERFPGLPCRIATLSQPIWLVERFGCLDHLLERKLELGGGCSPDDVFALCFGVTGHSFIKFQTKSRLPPALGFLGSSN